MADDDRRAGDWQKRDLRKNANDLIEEPNQKDNPAEATETAAETDAATEPTASTEPADSAQSQN